MQREFFQKLYTTSKSGNINLRSIKNEGGVNQAFINFSDYTGIEKFCNQNFKNNLCFGIALRNGGGKKANITEIPALWIEYDYKLIAGTQEKAESLINEKLQNFPLMPSAIINSGGGIHVYWFLSETAKHSDIDQVEGILKSLQVHFSSDPSCTDASRILRIPGTINRKPQRNNAKCELAVLNDNRYALGDFDSAIEAVSDYDGAIEDAEQFESESVQDTDLLPAWPVLNDDVYHGILGDFCRAACAGNREVDPAAVLSTMLCRAGVEIGVNPFLRVGDGFNQARIYVLIVGSSGDSRKGTSAQSTHRVFKQLTIENAKDEGRTPISRSMTGALRTGEGLVMELTDEIGHWEAEKTPKKKKAKQGTDSDQEPESDGIDLNTAPAGERWVVDVPGVTDKRLFILEEEFKSVLASISRKEETLSTVIRALFDDGNHEPLIKYNRCKVTGGHLGIVAHCTFFELKKNLDKLDIFNGFANRFLWVAARNQGSFFLEPGMTETAIENLAREFKNRFNAARHIKKMSLDSEALKLFKDYYDKSHHAETDGTIAALSTRLRSTLPLRIAMIYAALDGVSVINKHHAAAGIAWADYGKQTIKFIFLEQPEKEMQNKILNILPATATELYRAFGNHMNKSKLDEILKPLIANNLIKVVTTKRQGRGKDAKRYERN